MINRPVNACLVIADITGYTSYLAGVELDHAQDILGDLIATVVGSLRPSFKLAKLEGDAAFMFVAADEIDGSALQDTIEGCYFGFRRRLRDIGQASRCECDACIRIPTLDLKVVAHHGSVIQQRIAGSAELVGADVVLVHRLLKNSVEATLGVTAYALYTDACTRAMGLTDPAGVGFVRHTEAIEHIGAVDMWVRDLRIAWTAELERRRIRITDQETLWRRETILDAPPAIVWEYLTSPIRRPQYSTDVIAIVENAAGGRRGAGTVNHCMHGKDAIIEEILDWQPGEYWTTRNEFPIPGSPKVLMSDELEGLPDGRTRVTTRIGRGRTAKARAFLAEAMPMIEHAVTQAIGDLTPAVEADARERQRVADLVAAPVPTRDPIAPDPIRLDAIRHVTQDDVDSTGVHSS